MSITDDSGWGEVERRAKRFEGSIPKESIKVIPPTEYSIPPITRYEWTCPQCNTTVHGDAKSDTLFEIRHDPLCIYCRVKNGEFTFGGGSFKRVAKPNVLPTHTGYKTP